MISTCYYSTSVLIAEFEQPIRSRVSNRNSVARNCAKLREIARNACYRLRHFIARNCAIIANREAIRFSWNCAQRNCFASKNMCISEEMNQTNGSARYTKFCDLSMILSVANQNSHSLALSAIHTSRNLILKTFYLSMLLLI